MSPIRGPRYRCQDIRCHPDGVGFDLCSDCMENGTKHAGDHLMLRITGHPEVAAVPVPPLVPVVCNSSTASARPPSAVPPLSAVTPPTRPPAVARPATSPGRSRGPTHHTPPALAPVRSSASSRPTTAPVHVINVPAPSTTTSNRRSRLLSVLSS
ncbi:hypothetical protein IW261DRAFT_401816 [Armillaria novae-zelandiae]|uniref:ZZ-type domain-containing protein n=1 Tax=Armillaria novae-zelandiae TaxID=153914 RepID=A0AA39PS68_9AGAR|nr:hypothetical protein IW261DRAFT_401816 [Armillaria novae-zelandiae]